ncbi:ABC transporter substrate-binding protein [Rhodopseudomonas palustris]|uniref:ABC transporter substrate-binding protein n=1 Tax=Rhodopseudomonas palustris TaxID=1076 RepID=UPI000E5A1693|nr:ABC transporter substrate-binding protein [Rhodopseudomonas palustris]QLH70745.1 ABC transporter substrate-binding protein [Rhodopseudomonas palustris]RHZ95977.1 branched-chain amino acid ABC transporter substrate-binding protein [Rhodopseudomonas palustris]
MRLFGLAAVVAATSLFAPGVALAQKSYGPGASDTEIKVGNFVPYSGPASAYGIVGQVQSAYVKMLNEKGGINGRKINFISYDDAYSPPKAVEQTRKLVEGDEVLFLYHTLGTPSNTAVMKYLNQKKVPQLMLSSGGTRFGDDPKTYPWTMPFNPPYQAEGRIYAKWIMATYPNAKIAVLVANDDYGKDIYKGVKDGFGAKTSMIISEATYDITDPTIDSQMAKLKASGADLFLNLSTPKFAALAIRKMGELGWKPVHILNNVSSSVGAVIKPAGMEYAQDAITANYVKDPTDPTWKNDPGVKEWDAFLEKYMPGADRSNGLLLYSYGAGQTLEYILRQAGDNLTRENIMKVATSLKGYAPASLLPGITMNTSPTDHFPIEQMQLMRFKGDRWEMFGDVLEARVTN